jgi:hypothetical protein
MAQTWPAVVPIDFQPFFSASVAASAALIGLLFVSVSIAPQRVFGTEAEPVRQAQALSAFSALANVFFISMASLIPSVIIGLVVMIIAIPASVQTLALLLLLPKWRVARITGRGLLLFGASAVIYGYEFAIGLQLWRDPADKGALVNLVFLILGAYAIGLGRAWELLGAPRSGFFSYVWALLRALPPKPDEKPKV